MKKLCGKCELSSLSVEESVDREITEKYQRTNAFGIRRLIMGSYK